MATIEHLPRRWPEGAQASISQSVDTHPKHVAVGSRWNAYMDDRSSWAHISGSGAI